MAINLQKGQTINLEKNLYDLSSVTIGLGWDVAAKIGKKGFFASLFSNTENDDYDLDAIAFLLDKDGKVANTGDNKLEGGDVIFFNNLRLYLSIRKQCFSIFISVKEQRDTLSLLVCFF